VPFALGERLFAAAREPKRFFRVPAGTTTDVSTRRACSRPSSPSRASDGVNGRVCVVTGARSGIGPGRQGRSPAWARRWRSSAATAGAAGDGRRAAGGVRQRRRALFLADLSSAGEIRRLAAELCDRYPRPSTCS